MTPERLEEIRAQIGGTVWVPFAERQNTYLAAAEDLLAELDQRAEASQLRDDLRFQFHRGFPEGMSDK